jgi:hypothetical protein
VDAIWSMRRIADMAKNLAVGVALVAALSGCSGAHEASTTPQPATSAPAATLESVPPVDAKGVVSGGGHVRVGQRFRTVPMGASAVALTVPGVGALHVHCSAHPTTTFVLTSWARGEGPPVVRHVHASLSQSVSPLSLDRLTAPPSRTAGHGPVAYDQWQAAVFSEAFSGTATVWSVVAPHGGSCQAAAQSLLVTHGPFARYAH